MRDQQPSRLIYCAGLGKNGIPRLFEVIPSSHREKIDVTARVAGEVSLARISRGGLFDLSVEGLAEKFSRRDL
jgi:hypothetical protein